MPQFYTETSTDWISRGTNVNAGTLPAMRVVGFATSSTYGDAIDALSVVGNVRMKGITAKAIGTLETGDVYVDGCVPVESDGTATITSGQKLTVNATNGRVLAVGAVGGTNYEVIGVAETDAAATAGAVVMCRIKRFTFQG